MRFTFKKMFFLIFLSDTNLVNAESCYTYKMRMFANSTKFPVSTAHFLLTENMTHLDEKHAKVWLWKPGVEHWKGWADAGNAAPTRLVIYNTVLHHNSFLRFQTLIGKIHASENLNHIRKFDFHNICSLKYVLLNPHVLSVR